MSSSSVTSFPASAPQINRRKQSIMLVDDDPIFRNFITALLEKEGYDVSQAEHGLDGLKQLKYKVPDLIVCDISMPILDGIEFAEEICWEYPDVPMIVVSATEKMSDVARALRFGVKDFLTKPITQPANLTSAISNVLDEDNDTETSCRDFSSQWFRVGEKGEIPEDKELHWHLDYLQRNPGEAKDLLLALLPERDTRQGNWVCSYNLLQSSESMPLLFDYAWVMDGQFVFYIVDTSSEDKCGVAAALLVRALFNDCLRKQGMRTDKLKMFITNLEKGLSCLNCTDSVNVLVGVVDMAGNSIKIIPAGLEAVWKTEAGNHHISPGTRLGDGVAEKMPSEEYRLLQGGKLSLSNIGANYFSLDIHLKRN